jgi:hypothetical protein
MLLEMQAPHQMAATIPPDVARLVTDDLPVMLILRGVAGNFAGREWPDGALDEQPALDYAALRGYRGEIIDAPGTTSDTALQVRLAVEAIRTRREVQALYGFSGGAYNIRRILSRVKVPEQIRLVVVLGAEKNPKSLYRGPWELVYRKDPPEGHMAGPRVLLREAQA